MSSGTREDNDMMNPLLPMRLIRHVNTLPRRWGKRGDSDGTACSYLSLTTHGSVLCKFWLQIDSETQLTRFNDRETSTDKQWKITPDDWRNREKWPAYEMAVNDMLQKTNTTCAPWTVVEGNNKQYARLKVLQSVIRAVEERLDAEKA